ncbi:SAM-dependent methyltransferase [Vibrio splendidus]|uniref:SAM-dependent methyltransferase n=1 Tax=Vibrio splendidus TaxID=29497 RepID=UPI0003135435|nr:SAM-dependent methyltransferase [Vibrio splendidus]OED78186.1 hypothetical protein A144_22605 [Vibrio splendidus ZF-90]OEF21508.1 hypothetical protein A145_07320 [Vibrio splendidus 5S-101]PTO54485.1 hypothetical protein CWN94_09850 [Vibrio splendidus]PTP37176.1 hypothetical protein CWN95_02820 [Vibrio splendidus]PTP76245.1 hypothetical protein CWO00_11800 [Vibrio splendidus]
MNVLNQGSRFPEKKERSEAWETLVKEIAQEGFHNSTGEEASPSQTPGQLTVIGSGIEAVGFSRQDERCIDSADYVFYCVADPATVVWIKSKRPDAHDLYVLYDDNKPRYKTYMQMTEAMLHYVRKGKHVLGIYYGHPGVFVLSTHRAIEIARREGHRADMRPGISALDCLCADLGVDPSTPGLQTFEASDMLIRDKKPDISSHVVLWQVGLIGELGYRRIGYLNKNFNLLLDYLTEFYGSDYTITNYIASRYPGIPPTIERYKISELYNPELQSKVTGISTFYIAPKDVHPVNVERAIQLGMIQTGDKPRFPDTPLRKIAQYSTKEKRALDELADFKVPNGYKWQDDTLSSRFVLKLLEDPDLLRQYETQPSAALQQPFFNKMSEREHQLMASRDAGQVQIAAKGLHARSEGNLALLNEIVASTKLARRVAKAATLEDFYHLVDKESIDRDCLFQDIHRLNSRSAHLWSGVYYDAKSSTLICMLAPHQGPSKIVLTINGETIQRAYFRQGCLYWKANSTNQTEGVIRFARLSATHTIAIGSVATKDRADYTNGRIEAVGIMPFAKNSSETMRKSVLLNQHLKQSLYGDYVLRHSTGQSKPTVQQLCIGSEEAKMNGIKYVVTHIGSDTLKLTSYPEDGAASLELRFVYDPLASAFQCFGSDDVSTRLMGIKRDDSGSAALIEAEFTLGLENDPLRYVRAFAQIGSDSGGIMFWSNWQKIAQSGYATARLLDLINQAK